jgi:2'-5' RNA ligase
VKKRLFIAVDISDEARDAAAHYIKQMSENTGQASVKWERTEKLHLTLKFLGNTDNELESQIVEVVERNAGRTKPFSLAIVGTSAFPSAKSPRVLWLGVSEQTGAMKELAVQVDRDCARLGFEPEKRPFNPHLTIARIRDPRIAGKLGSEHVNRSFGPVTFTCDELVIYESHLGRGGSTYEKPHTARFRA